jgi:hypothetical protein
VKNLFQAESIDFNTNSVIVKVAVKRSVHHEKEKVRISTGRQGLPGPIARTAVQKIESFRAQIRTLDNPAAFPTGRVGIEAWRLF